MGGRHDSHANRVGRIRWSEFELVDADAADIPGALIAIQSSDEVAALDAARTLENGLPRDRISANKWLVQRGRRPR
jgi:hypothetical protein